MPGMIDKLFATTVKDWEPFICTCKGMKPHFHIPIRNPPKPESSLRENS